MYLGSGNCAGWAGGRPASSWNDPRARETALTLWLRLSRPLLSA
jgi:hypothetical protein